MTANRAKGAGFSPPRLFISYARGDGRGFVEGFEARLAEADLTSWRDLRDVEGGEDILPQVLSAIENAEHLVLILTPRALRSDWVKAEWTHARAAGCKVSPVLADPNLARSDLPPWIRRADIYDPDEPERWAKLIAVLRGPGEARRVPYHTGHLPDSFVPRPGPYDRLKQGILQADGGVVGLSTALIGAGGYGKTTLANALCRDEDIRFEFSDGVLRVEIGKDRTDVLGLVSDLIETLDPGGQRPGFTDVNVAAEQLAHRLDKARLLLVLDDVWRESQLQPFLRGGPNCVRLITTRSPRVLGAATRIDVDELTPTEAQALLCWQLPAPSPAALGQLRALTQRLEGWAQMIDIANGWLRSRIAAGRDLDTALEDFTRRLDRRGLTAFDPRDADARNRAIGLCVDASLEDLTDAERARFTELAILPEDTDTPIAITAALWAQTGGLDDIEGEDLLDRLADLSLLQRLDLGRQTVRLHDNMKWLLGDRLGAAETQAAHAAMAEALLARAGGAWSAAPVEDSYSWRHAPAHLRAAGRAEDADALLLDPGWIAGRLAALGATSLAEAGRPEPTAEDARLVARALALSVPTLQEHPDQLPLQLAGRLLDLAVGRIPALLAEASRSSRHPATPKRAFLTPPGAERLRLIGHEGWVLAVAFSPDGARIATASRDRTARVWDAETGAEIAALRGHEGSVRAIAFSPDGAGFVTGSDDQTARIWDAETGAEIATLRGHESRVQAVAFSPDGARIATASHDRTARVWDAETGAEVARLRGHEGWVRAIAFSPDGSRIATTSDDHTARVWDAGTGAEIATLRGHEDGVRAIAFSPDGSGIATASDDGTARVWDTHTGSETACLRGHKGWVQAIAFSPDGAHIATASRDGTARVWNAETGAVIAELSGHQREVVSIAFSSFGARVATASHDRTARIWNAETGAEVARLCGHESWVAAVAISPDNTYIATGSLDGTARLWNATGGAEIDRFRGHEKAVRAIAFSPDSTRIATVFDDDTVRVWHSETGVRIAKLCVHEGWVNAVAFSADGTRIATAANMGTDQVWDAETGTRVVELCGHEDPVSAIIFSPDGARIATGSGDCTARIWDAKTGAETACLSEHEDWVEAVTFSPDGTRIATASNDETARVWDTETGAVIAVLRGHRDWVQAVAFSPDGARIATASHDCTARVWDAETGAAVAALRGHEGWVQAVAFSPDGSHIVTGSDDRTLRIWDGQDFCLDTIINLDATVRTLTVMDRSLAVGDALGRVGIFDLNWPE
ncbi:hypothetical protein CCR87_09080 [Rhodobaculum claviforme]|uniref:TIR domain-containing protein n=2 Tax=Rhodobaculum claviforme TaxID=1549854 RepID=A0A934TL61_9RHOB|nr:hypothetical protein [Rhodobaculum claviforme]